MPNGSCWTRIITERSLHGTYSLPADVLLNVGNLSHPYALPGVLQWAYRYVTAEDMEAVLKIRRGSHTGLYVHESLGVLWATNLDTTNDRLHQQARDLWQLLSN